MFKPSQSWADYLEMFPKGKSPIPEDVFLRWDEYEEINDGRHPERRPQKVRKNVGEKNAYQAWLAELMDPNEAEFFEHAVLRVEALVELALVPLVRKLAKSYLLRDGVSLYALDPEQQVGVKP
jgi:hypothetical protein